jgi:hypothetical protein
MAVPNTDFGGIASGATQGLKDVVQMGLQMKQGEAQDQQIQLQKLQVQKAQNEMEEMQKKKEADAKPISWGQMSQGMTPEVSKNTFNHLKSLGLLKPEMMSDGKTPKTEGGQPSYTTTMGDLKAVFSQKEEQNKFAQIALDSSWTDNENTWQATQQKYTQMKQSGAKMKPEDEKAYKDAQTQYQQKKETLLHSDMKFKQQLELAKEKSLADLAKRLLVQANTPAAQDRSERKATVADVAPNAPPNAKAAIAAKIKKGDVIRIAHKEAELPGVMAKYRKMAKDGILTNEDKDDWAKLVGMGNKADTLQYRSDLDSRYPNTRSRAQHEDVKDTGKKLYEEDLSSGKS